MNELDAIQAQMANLGVDVSPNNQMPQDNYVPSYQLEHPELTEQDMNMLKGYAAEDQPGMPAYDLEALKMDISPMLQGLPKEEFANLIIRMSEQWTVLNTNTEE